MTSRPYDRLAWIVLLILPAVAVAGCGPAASSTATSAAGRIQELGGVVEPDPDHAEGTRVTLTGWKGKSADYALAAKVPNLSGLYAARRDGVEPFPQEALPAFKDLSSLKDLDLDGTDVDDAGAKTIASFAALERLHLERTRVGDDGLKALGGLKSLRHLYLKGSRTTADAAKIWRDKHPNCNLHLTP